VCHFYKLERGLNWRAKANKWQQKAKTAVANLAKKRGKAESAQTRIARAHVCC
jgi:hypothetical protein